MFREKVSKILVSSLCVVTVGVPSISIVSAMENNNLLNKNVEYSSIDLESDNIETSDVMTYDEIAKEISKDKNISINEAKSMLGEEQYRNYSDVISEIAIKNNVSRSAAKSLIDSRFIIETKSGIQVRATYRTIGKRVTVNSAYKPKIKWYCKTDEGGGYVALLKIIDTSLDRNYNGAVKQFSGSIFTHLETPTRIFYRINGDFSTGGNTTVTGGGEISLGGKGSLNFSISGKPGNSIYHFSEGYYKIHS